MPITIFTEITINASASSVSQILYDLHSYHKWNSWISIVGSRRTNLIGSKLLIDEFDSQYEAVILLAYRNVLTWKWYDKCCMAHLHVFEIVPEGDYCVFKHGERCSGVTAWTRTFTQYYEKRQAVFEQFNRELKAFAESEWVELIKI